MNKCDIDFCTVTECNKCFKSAVCHAALHKSQGCWFLLKKSLLAEKHTNVTQKALFVQNLSYYTEWECLEFHYTAITGTTSGQLVSMASAVSCTENVEKFSSAIFCFL